MLTTLTPRLRLVAVVTMAVLVLGAPHFYLWVRLVHGLALPQPWFTLSTALLAVLPASLPAALILQRTMPTGVARMILWPAFVWFGLMFLLLVSTAGTDFAWLVVSLERRVVSGTWPAGPEIVHVARAAYGGACLVACAATAYSIFQARRPAPVRYVRVPLRRLPAELSGTTIVQISDLHLGPTLGRSFLESVVQKINELSPDVVVITGDLADERLSQIAETVAPLARLKARYGVYFITGNHEYYLTQDGITGANRVLETVRRLGVRPLMNQRVAIGDGRIGFDLAGIPDRTGCGLGDGHTPDLERALAGRDPARELVLLAHQPRAVRVAARHGVGLQLSGHTHGGQIWPFGYLVALVNSFLAGLYRHGETWLYVSRGTGYWGPPMRLAAPSEITHITVEKGSE